MTGKKVARVENSNVDEPRLLASLRQQAVLDD
jgi:hypothetical protein